MKTSRRRSAFFIENRLADGGHEFSEFDFIVLGPSGFFDFDRHIHGRLIDEFIHGDFHFTLAFGERTTQAFFLGFQAFVFAHIALIDGLVVLIIATVIVAIVRVIGIVPHRFRFGIAPENSIQKICLSPLTDRCHQQKTAQ